MVHMIVGSLLALLGMVGMGFFFFSVFGSSKMKKRTNSMEVWGFLLVGYTAFNLLLASLSLLLPFSTGISLPVSLSIPMTGLVCCVAGAWLVFGSPWNPWLKGSDRLLITSGAISLAGCFVNVASAIAMVLVIAGSP